jgi:hypothetical protein
MSRGQEESAQVVQIAQVVQGGGILGKQIPCSASYLLYSRPLRLFAI